MMRKQVSKRRWKARARLGRHIPLEAIENHRLFLWFEFASVSLWSDFYSASLRCRDSKDG